MVGHMRRHVLVGAIFLFSLLCSSAAIAGPFSNLTLVYEANFDDGTLSPSLNALGIGPMQIGDTLVPGTNPSAVLEDGGVTLSITRPSGTAPGPVSVGAVATPVSFGLGSIFGARAVYELPVGPHGATDSWAAALLVRTGSVSDLAAELRAAATFQVNGSGARLNTPFATTPAGLPNIPQSVYDAIFAPADADPATFTLEFLVDRTTGLGYASLTSGNFSVTRSNFTFLNFGANFGPTITALEPGIAIASGADTTASVRLLDFQVFAQIPEPPTWGIFGCCLLILGAGKFSANRRDRRVADHATAFAWSTLCSHGIARRWWRRAEPYDAEARQLIWRCLSAAEPTQHHKDGCK